MRAFICRTAMAAALAVIAGEALAATTTTTFQVNAMVTGTCSVSATNLTFGNYDPLAAQPLDGASTVSVQCTLTTGYGVGLSAGTGSGATVTTRKMTHSSDTLDYSLYQDAARSLVWGETGGEVVSGTGTGLAQNLSVYGRIPAGQNVNPGGYSDVITVTVTF